MILVEYNFVEAGEWWLKPEVKSGITFSLGALKEDRVLYAFVVGSELKYIGICEKYSTTLNDRMRRYQSQAGAGTNERVARRIKAALESGGTVKIWALKPPTSMSYRGLHVDLVKGLENPLIEMFAPPWNR